MAAFSRYVPKPASLGNSDLKAAIPAKPAAPVSASSCRRGLPQLPRLLAGRLPCSLPQVARRSPS
jgi:hypothetical protein